MNPGYYRISFLFDSLMLLDYHVMNDVWFPSEPDENDIMHEILLSYPQYQEYKTNIKQINCVRTT